MFCEKEPYILVFGVSIYDIIGFTNRNFKPHDSNPGKVRVSFGGVCRNIAENLARVGVNTKFISVVGDDEKGRSLLEHSAAKAKPLKHLIPYLHTIKPNRLEAEVLCGFPIKNLEDIKRAGKYFLDQGVQKVFISLDIQGVYYNDRESEGILKADKVSIVNVTGAGDSCVAGLGFGFMNGLDTRNTLKMAIAMSVITIAHADTIHPDMSYDLVNQSMDSITWVEETIF